MLAEAPQIRIHRGKKSFSIYLSLLFLGYISVQDALFSMGTNEPYSVGAPYTFELYMEDTTRQDYIIESCTMNGAQFIGAFGLVYFRFF